MIQRFFQRLFCKHKYEVTGTKLINMGMQKIQFQKCKKCGKERTKY